MLLKVKSFFGSIFSEKSSSSDELMTEPTECKAATKITETDPVEENNTQIDDFAKAEHSRMRHLGY